VPLDFGVAPSSSENPLPVVNGTDAQGNPIALDTYVHTPWRYNKPIPLYTTTTAP
jgi:hypothetical protein